MTKAHPAPTTAVASRRFHPALLLLFAGSGCSALIYEIVWYQLLQLVIGSTAVSLGVLLATCMGGLCLGSLLLPRFLSPSRHPLRVYAAVELGIGLCGILALVGMPLVSGIYVAAAAHGFPSVLLRALICAACLLPPTMLMGASLPAAAGWLKTSAEGVSWMGLLYGANTAGAVFGCLLAGFYLLRVFDMTTATLAAAAINVAVALVSCADAAPGREHWRPGRSLFRRALFRRAGLLAGVCDHRALRRHRLGRGSDLDASARLDVGSHGLHLRHHSGGVPGGLGAGQRRRVLHGADGEAAAGRRLLPVAAGLRNRLDRRDAEPILALLAPQSAAFDEPLVHLPGRPGALPVGHPAANAAVGRQFSARAGGCGVAGRGFRAAGRRHLRRQYRRRHPGCALLQYDSGALDRHTRLRTRAGGVGRGERPVCAGATGDVVPQRPRLAGPRGCPGDRRFAGFPSFRRSSHADRLRPPYHDIHEPLQDPVYRRRHELLHRHLGVG